MVEIVVDLVDVVDDVVLDEVVVAPNVEDVNVVEVVDSGRDKSVERSSLEYQLNKINNKGGNNN